MSRVDRRQFLRLAGLSAAGTLLPPVIEEALAIPAYQRSGSIDDVGHVVILMQENRSFDHYFGMLPGVRGFNDRLTIPQAAERQVWQQRDALGLEVLPYHLDMHSGNAQRVSGTPHSWLDAQLAWNHGRFGAWPRYKTRPSMAYYTQAELPFQYALAEAFTVCDAYHCSVHGGTNPNRLFLFTGSNDPRGTGGGPAIDNRNDDLGPVAEGYRWTTYAERLEAAGISWKLYQNMDDNFTDNPLEGFASFRRAHYEDRSSPLMKALSSTLSRDNLDGLRNDVLAGALPQVSWVIAPSAYSEHTGPSSPVQGAWYVQEVLKALIADPQVWSRTALLVMFDENDGFFDHMPPPAAPSLAADGSLAGASTVDDSSERHRDGRVYGPGPRVPMWVVSPWSRGGWVDSQVFDHSSVIRFLEARFGVVEPNISAWRRAVCGDLTSAFNFRTPNSEPLPLLPERSRAEADAIRAAQERLPAVTVPLGAQARLPQAPRRTRPSRALPYALEVDIETDLRSGTVDLAFINHGTAGAVFQVYDQLQPLRLPRRYTVEAGKTLIDSWSAGLLELGRYDLWILGPNGFHRRCAGTLDIPRPRAARPRCRASTTRDASLLLQFGNDGDRACSFSVRALAYRDDGPWVISVAAGGRVQQRWPLQDSGRWYDFEVSVDSDARFARRYAGRIENGEASISDPAM